MRLISLSALLSLSLSGCTITTVGRPISYTSRPVALRARSLHTSAPRRFR